MNPFLPKNKKMFASIIIICTFVGFIFIYSIPISSKETKQVVPTIFIHGFKGGYSSFGTMLDRFERYQWGSKTMICKVSPRGDISVVGKLPENNNNPFIQVIFEDNRASIKDQTIWLKKIMYMLYTQYKVQQVNIVSHSMGGLTSTNFLEHNDGKLKYPLVEKLIVIGSPFKGITVPDYFVKNTGDATVDLRKGSPALQSLYNNKTQFDKNVHVLAIAGVISEPNVGDGLVSLESALGIRWIVHPKMYSEKVIIDQHATHSGLHEHKDVDKLIGEFLWETK